MRVVVQKDGISAKDENGTIYKIASLIIEKKNSRNEDIEVPYGIDTNFFKTACPSGTEHTAKLTDNEMVNLY